MKYELINELRVFMLLISVIVLFVMFFGSSFGMMVKNGLYGLYIVVLVMMSSVYDN